MQVFGSLSESIFSTVNWNKTEALLSGQWQGEDPPHLPQQCLMNTEGLKILGIFFGTQQYMANNWDGVVEQVLGREIYIYIYILLKC